VRWRIAALVSIAISISYLDRQTLPLAVQVIQPDIPLNNSQFSALQSAFLVSYALMYAGEESWSMRWVHAGASP
jgi:MFS transporter, ACS family, hexuronate transporter